MPVVEAAQEQESDTRIDQKFIREKRKEGYDDFRSLATDSRYVTHCIVSD
jgi:predicted DNA-binding WGR domain protein